MEIHKRNLTTIKNERSFMKQKPDFRFSTDMKLKYKNSVRVQHQEFLESCKLLNPNTHRFPCKEREKTINRTNFKLLSKLVDIQQGRYTKADNVNPNSNAAISQ